MISTSDEFHELANGSVRPLNWGCNISFTKNRNTDTAWFTLNQSQLDGGDILSMNSEQPIQLWDYYDYENYADRLMDMTVNRSVEFPYNVQSAILDFTLDNHDGYFTYDADTTNDSPITPYILPKRPIRTYLGFKGVGQVPVFVGLTQELPSYSGVNDTTMKWTAMDFLSEIGNQSLGESVMLRDARTDEAIAVILNSFGLDSSMYSLDAGMNTIPFVFFEKGKNAGNALKELVEAENGKLWLDETGIIRFSPRTSDIGKTPVATFTSANIIEFTPSRTDGIYNRVKINSNIRVVQDKQPIFSADNENGYQSSASDDSYRISSYGNKQIWLSFDDPIWTATTEPVLAGDESDSFFTAVDLSGNEITTGITATGTLFSDTMLLTFTNANGFPVSINFLQIWGEPAKVVDEIKYDAYDEDSVEKFGNMTLEITDNNFFGSYQNVDSFATDVLSKRAEYSPTLKLKVKGDPSLQLGDIITVDYKFNGDYKIVGINQSLNQSGLITELTVEKFETLSPFILDVSVLDGSDVLS